MKIFESQYIASESFVLNGEFAAAKFSDFEDWALTQRLEDGCDI